MALSNDDLYAKASELSQDVEDNFLDLARALRQLLDRDPALFQRVYAKTDLGKRKAYYLVEISRVYDPLPIPKGRLKKLGWTKLQLLGKHVTKDNWEELFELAHSLPTKQLERKLKGEKPVQNAHCVLMYFTPAQYHQLETALLKHGGQRSGRGILNKEVALLRAIKAENDAGHS